MLQARVNKTTFSEHERCDSHIAKIGYFGWKKIGEALGKGKGLQFFPTLLFNFSMYQRNNFYLAGARKP